MENNPKLQTNKPNQQFNKQNAPVKKISDIPVSVIENMVRADLNRIELKKDELAFRTRELDANVEMGKLSLNFQFQLKEKEDKERRQNIITYASCIAVFALIFFGFIGWLLSTGHREFAIEFLKWIGYILGLLLSFWAGRLSVSKANKKSSNETEDPQIVQ